MYTAAAGTDANHQGDVIDLIPYVGPVQRLVSWYDRLNDPAASEPDIYELDDIVRALQGLVPLTGQLGRDLAVITDATDDALRGDIIDAIGRLRRLATLDVLDDSHRSGPASKHVPLSGHE